MFKGTVNFLKIHDSAHILFIALLLFTTLLTANKVAMANSATLSWTPPTTNADGSPLTNLAGYKVYFGTTSHVYGTPTDVGLIGGTSPSYTVNNLGNGTYYFAVTAYDSLGLESSYSTEGSKTFTVTGPTISGISAGNMTTGGAVINWTTNVSATSQVEYGSTTAYGTLSTLDSTLVTSHSQTLTGLQAGTTYHFRVKSADGSGNLTNSGDNTFTTISATPPVISAIASSNITSSGATITWTTNITATSQVEYGSTTSYGSLSTLDSTLVNGHSQSLSGLQAGTLYHFRVRSADGAGNLAVSGDNTLTTVSIPLPVISAVASSNITSSGAIITWTTNITATSQVEYGTTTAYGFSTALDANLVTSHSQTLNGLQAGTTYHFRVDSANSSGNLSISTDFTFTTSPSNTTTTTTGPVISNVTVSNITSSSAVVTWSTNISANSQVEYGTVSTYGFATPLDSTLLTGHSQSLSGLQPGTLYHIRVDSADSPGNLALSTDYTFTTNGTAFSNRPSSPKLHRK